MTSMRVRANQPSTRAANQPRRGLDRHEAATYIGVSIQVFDRMVAEGTLPEPTELGGEAIWDLVKLDKAFDTLTGSTQQRNPWK